MEDDYNRAEDDKENMKAYLTQLESIKLTPEQIELIQMRKQLLHLSDKLSSYEVRSFVNCIFFSKYSCTFLILSYIVTIFQFYFSVWV